MNKIRTKAKFLKYCPKSAENNIPSMSLSPAYSRMSSMRRIDSVSENPRFSRCKICNANLHINGLKIAYLNERPLSKLWEP